MKYSTMLRDLFGEVELHAGDLLLLESFQVAYLPGRVPQKEFAELIRRYPYVKELLIVKYPPIRTFLNSLLNGHQEISDEELVSEYCEKAVWEIADLIIYNKFPELYDEKVSFHWTLDEIISKYALDGKVIADVGAGTGQLAFLLAPYVDTVFAIEPISGLRTYMKQKASKYSIRNLFVMDGFLESIQLPENFLDMLFTSNAIGWNLEKELMEIERVVKPNGLACHIMRMEKEPEDNPVHETLVSCEWKYKCNQASLENSMKAKYVKRILKF
jgi:ubiquinone/menaquinone biosynthesis C-methylase UbiE